MKLFGKILILIAAILIFKPITSEAGFYVKKATLATSSNFAAGENANKVFTSAITGTYKASALTALSHRKAGSNTFLGKISQKLSHIKEAFSAGKKKWIAILLGFLDIFVLGFIGLPRFYMGYTAEGLMQLIFTLLGIVGVVCIIFAFGLANSALLIPAFLCIGLCLFSEIWQIVDLIRIMCNSLKPKEGYWEK